MQEEFKPSKEWNKLFTEACDLKSTVNFYRSDNELSRREITKSVGEFWDAYTLWLEKLDGDKKCNVHTVTEAD